ncbi:MAG: heavy metal translocating P-type ATPase, partial [Eubacteriales bacterium]|nr:heavy metal translocating P-type ATPase [Eubacteriales bacterium]
MKKAYSLTGIDCANCAQQLEDELRKLPVVKKVSYHFPTKRLAVSYSDDPTAEAQLKELIAKREPEAVLKPYGTASAPQNNSRLYLLIAALVLFLIGFFLRLKFGSFNIFSTLFPATEEALESGLAHGASKAGGVEVLPGSFGFTMQITSLLAFALSYILAAKRVYRKAFRNLKMGRLLDENLLMIIASLGAILLGEYPEAVAVMLFFAWGEYLEDRAVDASRRSIEETMNIMPEEASLLKDGQAITVKPEELVVGDIILIRPGAKVPADGVVVEGHSQLDSKAITGESLPLEVGPGDNVLSGCVNQSALLSLKVTKAYEDSTVARMLQLIADAAEKRSPTERFITRFARYYTPAVVGIAALLAVIPPLLNFGSFSTWLYRALIFLVASCPCALVISVPLAYFAGLGAASRQGILVKGGNALEELAKAHTLILDKTGTLTEGNFAISGLETADGVSETELLEAAIIGEAGSQHPLAVALRQSVQRLCLSGGCKLCAIEEEKQHPASTAAEQDCCADSHAHGDGCCADGHT